MDISAATASAPKLAAKVAAAPAPPAGPAGAVAEWPISASKKTIAAPAAHRNRRKRRQGKGRRLSAAAVAPLTMKASPAIAHQGPAARSCIDLVEKTFSHKPTRS